MVSSLSTAVLNVHSLHTEHRCHCTSGPRSRWWQDAVDQANPAFLNHNGGTYRPITHHSLDSSKWRLVSYMLAPTSSSLGSVSVDEIPYCRAIDDFTKWLLGEKRSPLCTGRLVTGGRHKEKLGPIARGYGPYEVTRMSHWERSYIVRDMDGRELCPRTWRISAKYSKEMQYLLCGKSQHPQAYQGAHYHLGDTVATLNWSPSGTWGGGAL
ncbi:hypothetical protein Tco_0313479 [Tanacetum coccineum]